MPNDWMPESGWTLSDWQRAYRSGELTARDALQGFLSVDEADPAWISRLDARRLEAQLEYLEARPRGMDGDLSHLPLYGIPFVVKDNIDAFGWPTTAACPDFTYWPQTDATVVRRLREAGAVLVGKTNLDQFATGLVGVRSPYGAVPNPFDARYLCGGSSSGSASLVARGVVPFSLGTDTAGSGRVPAGFTNIVGLKPTRGWLSTAGVVPACRTLDCVSIFALTVEDAEMVAAVAGAFDPSDPYSRPVPLDARSQLAPAPKVGVPAQLEFFGDDKAQAAFESAVKALEGLGARVVSVDFASFSELASLLYHGPWVAERFIVLEALLKRAPEAIDSVVRGIVEQGKRYSATEGFKAEYRRARLARAIARELESCDVLALPTSPTIYTLAEVAADPVALNTCLGTYTNFVNLADLCALAVPTGMRADNLPAGITLVAPAWRDGMLAALGRRIQSFLELPLGATGRIAAGAQVPPPAPATIRIAVVGAHLTGQPLNHQLTSRNASFVASTRTAANYRLYALAGTTPQKPGLVRAESGASIEVELWDMPRMLFGAFVEEVPPPLGIGTVRLEDGGEVKGFICEPSGLEGALDITAFGGWRAYLASLDGSSN